MNDLLSIVEEQSIANNTEFQIREAIEEANKQLKLPQMKRTLQESTIEVEDQLTELKQLLKVNTETATIPIPIDTCVLPKLVLVRFVEEEVNRWIDILGTDAKHHFILLGEVAQAPTHVVIVSVVSYKTISMIHAESLEIVPPDEC